MMAMLIKCCCHFFILPIYRNYMFYKIDVQIIKYKKYIELIDKINIITYILYFSKINKKGCYV